MNRASFFVSFIGIVSTMATITGCAPESEGTSFASAELAASTLRVVAWPERGLHEDLQAALGSAIDPDAPIDIPTVFRVERAEWGAERIILDLDNWRVTSSRVSEDTVGLWFEGDDAKRLYDAMTAAQVEDIPLIVGWQVTKRSGGGRVVCSFVTSHVDGQKYSCSLNALNSVGTERPLEE